MRFDHIAIAVRDIASAIDAYRDVGYVRITSGRVKDDARRVVLQMISVAGQPIELVSGEGVGSLLRRGGGVYHLCYGSHEFEHDIKRLHQKGWSQITDIGPAPLFAGRRVIFLMKTGLPILEIVEDRI